VSTPPNATSAGRVRPAAVAGAFYPGDPRALASEVEDLLAGVERLEPRLSFPKALVVPHAGYIYSGPVAAAGYDEIAPARGVVKRVVLLGPVHRVAVRGLALPGAEAFDTPLGRIPLDRGALRELAGLAQVVTSPPAHALEHSLEVQLPFLQKVLGGFSLVPLAVGEAGVEDVAEVIERLWGGPETLVVVSTDMSHYHEYEDARRIDGATLTRIASYATDIRHDEACGATPLNGLLAVAKRRGLPIRLLSACNSGDTAGGRGRVVGYSAFALDESDAVGREEAGRTLLAIARGAIERALGIESPPPARGPAPWLRLTGATFVTLMKEGSLRGCVGSLAPERALGEDVAQNALGAAFRDHRFPKLAREEWPRCEVEVSLLSAAKPLHFADEAEIFARIRPGEDGIILEHGGRRATFLPQVWEGIPEPRAFLEQLMKKAGIPEGTRLARCRLWRYRVAKWKETPLH
jgi:AmmeMemoRadiSam system protein B/AmmeMemoRadiSam system protein A